MKREGRNRREGLHAVARIALTGDGDWKIIHQHESPSHSISTRNITASGSKVIGGVADESNSQS